MRKFKKSCLFLSLFFVLFILGANQSQAATTVMTYTRPSNALQNGVNQILTVNLNSGAEKVYLRKFKISCQHNLVSDFAIKLRDSLGNELANSTAASGDFGSLNKEFTGALELKVSATLTGLTIPYDQNIVVCSVNNSDVELLNPTNGKTHQPNVEYSTVNNVSLNITNISNAILPNTKAAEILKYNFSLDDAFALDKITLECSSADINNVNLYNSSSQALIKAGSISSSGFVNSWAKIKYVFSGLNYPVSSNNLAYFFKADIPESMVSQTLKCAVTSEYSAKTLSGASQTINISGAVSEVKIQGSQLDITYNANNRQSSLSLKKGLKEFGVLWLNLHADSNTDLTITGATFKKYGELNNIYINKVSLYGNLRTFIQAKNVMASDTINFTGLNYVVRAAETHDLILEIDMADNIESNKDFYFYLTDLQAIDANGSTVKINATLPLQGNIMRVAETSVVNKPDLIVSDVSYSKMTDGLYDVKAKVKNIGDADAKGSFKVMAYQSSTHNYYKITPTAGIIAAGGYYEVSFTLEEGKYKFTADYDKVISEKDENNNYLEKDIAISTSLINNSIDLEIKNDGTVYTDNSDGSFVFYFKNTGNKTAPRGFKIKITNKVSGAVEYKTWPNDIAPGETVNFSYPSTPGSNEVEILLDSDNSISESNENNNYAIINYQKKLIADNSKLGPACSLLPCYFDAMAIKNSWATVDSPPNDISAQYPYSFQVDKDKPAVMQIRFDVWASNDDGHKNTMHVNVDGKEVYNFSQIRGNDEGLVATISLGILAQGAHQLEIFALPDQSYFHFDWFKIDYAPENTTISNNQVSDFSAKAKLLNKDNFSFILLELKQLRDTVKEQQTEIKYLKSMTADLRNMSEAMKSAINDFITYGVDANTVKLGAGERAAVINSYKAAFAKLPETEAELTDAIKIANGRFPSLTSDTAEKAAKEQFIKIYKRIPDLNDAQDNAAIKVMAYGLRQKAVNRNLNSEKSGIKIFKNIYGYTPKTTEDWNTMQAITYSGAAREKDSDGDLLSDEMEAQYGTDPNKADTDGDGFKDGVEVNTGYNPKGEGKL